VNTHYVNSYTKKPTTIEAVQWDGTLLHATYIDDWVSECTSGEERIEVVVGADGAPDRLIVQTREGSSLDLVPGAWLIRGIKGEFYPCQDEIFRDLHIMPKEK
jgi:hypothetical protein